MFVRNRPAAVLPLALSALLCGAGAAGLNECSDHLEEATLAILPLTGFWAYAWEACGATWANASAKICNNSVTIMQDELAVAADQTRDAVQACSGVSSNCTSILVALEREFERWEATTANMTHVCKTNPVPDKGCALALVSVYVDDWKLLLSAPFEDSVKACVPQQISIGSREPPHI